MSGVSRLLELKELEKAGLYVFHGTDMPDIELFEPRQAFSHGKPDGRPAVHAYKNLEPATFMAIIDSRKAGGWEATNNSVNDYVDKNTQKKAQHESWQGYIAVSISDLPEDIEILNL